MNEGKFPMREKQFCYIECGCSSVGIGIAHHFEDFVGKLSRRSIRAICHERDYTALLFAGLQDLGFDFAGISTCAIAVTASAKLSG